jgi:hypothetical protein
MQSVTVNVPEISSDERRVLEHVLGAPLQDDKSVVITVVPRMPSSTVLPEYFAVYEGLSDAEIEQVEKCILDRDQSCLQDLG